MSPSSDIDDMTHTVRHVSYESYCTVPKVQCTLDHDLPYDTVTFALLRSAQDCRSVQDPGPYFEVRQSSLLCI